ncbi:unnamed protein product [Prunus armeniaca]
MAGMMSVSPFEHGSSSHSQDASQSQGTSSTVGTITAQSQSSFPMGFTGVKASDSSSHGSYQPSDTSSASYQPNDSGSSNHFVPRGRGSNTSRFFNHSNHRGGFSPRYSSAPRSQAIPECQICNKRGHTAPNCYYRVPDASSPPILECQICRKKGHITLNCYHRANFAYQGTPPPQSL